jgi:hypothetical protein
LLILLLPPAIGIATGDKPDKPDRPGKPEPPPPTATFRISIGVKVGDDVVLKEPTYFDVVASVDGWIPKEKGKPRPGSWEIPLLEGRYGKYTMQNVYSEENGTHLHDFYKGELAQLHILKHDWNRQSDFWQIGFNWTTSDFNGDGEPDPLILEGWTDRGPEREGIYDSENDIWTVTFTTTNAYFIVFWCEVNDEGTDCWLYWCGYLEFTVTIQKNS